jgi:hypothetical protein
MIQHGQTMSMAVKSIFVLVVLSQQVNIGMLILTMTILGWDISLCAFATMIANKKFMLLILSILQYQSTPIQDSR